MLCTKYCPQICLCNPAATSGNRLKGNEMHFASVREERELGEWTDGCQQVGKGSYLSFLWFQA